MTIKPVYYNEFHDETASWLAFNIRRGLIAPGDVDTRSIKDVQPDDLKGYAQHHFFAGIGGWSFAARMAGWDDARPLWSASLPCQPFSAAGLGLGTDDSRHMWPDFYRLCDALRPPAIVGEQVAGEAGFGWFDGVRASLEASLYASRVVAIPACAVDSPQQRERLYWVAVALGALDMADREGVGGRPGLRSGGAGRRRRPLPANNDGARVGSVGGADVEGRQGHRGYDEPSQRREDRRDASANVGDGDLDRQLEPGRIVGEGGGRIGDANPRYGEFLDDGASIGRGEGWPQHAWLARGHAFASPTASDREARERASRERWGAGWYDNSRYDGGFIGAGSQHGRNRSWWGDADWIACHDNKARRVADSRAPLLVNGFPGRVLAWRGFGNAISPPLASEVIGALKDMLDANMS